MVCGAITLLSHPWAAASGVKNVQIVRQGTTEVQTFGDQWFTMPWLWLSLAALFLLVLTIILTRSDRESDA